MFKSYLEIIEHFGVRNQMKKLNEENFEFIEAVDNYEDLLNLSSGASKHDLELAREFVIEEMADIMTILTEFIAKYDIKKFELDHHMDYKLSRTRERINNGYYENKHY